MANFKAKDLKMGYEKIPCKDIKRFVWIDLEMTGLSVERDVLLEIACIITDQSLNIIDELSAIIIKQPESVLQTSDRWVFEQHTKTGLLQAAIDSQINVEQAENKVLEFVSRHCKLKHAPLCGNSVWMDRLFLRRYMPRLEQYLNYRVVDVSSIKILVNCWYGSNSTNNGEIFKKKNKHRALDDIKESIAELKFYQEKFFNGF